MGWWKEAGTRPEVELGDEPLDLVHEAVAAVSRAYQEDLGRKPTLEEFRRALVQALGGDPGRFFADMEEHVVGEVAFRLKKISKRQPFAVGNYFAIPLDGKFWYGRIVHRGAGDHLVEIYRVETVRLLTMTELLDRKREVVLNKHIFSIPAFTRGRWRILGHQDMSPDFKFPAFYGGLLAYGDYTVWRGDAESREPKARAMKYEPKQVWWPERVEDALRTKEFGEWPEVTADKKNTFDNHDRNLQFLHEYFKIPMKKKRK
jgi:hypothetical protein